MFKLDPLASIKQRAHSTLDWLPSDSKENYKAITSAGENEYSPTEIKYVFNEDGLRCDSFTLPSQLPILFAGCSITEGIGLHLKDVWSSLVLDQIKEKTNLDIPYWSIAIGGTGLDSTATWLNEIRKKNLGIKYIFVHSPPFARREFYFEGPFPKFWPTNNARIDELLADSYFAMGQSLRSLTIIDLIAELLGAKVIFSYWGGLYHEFEMVQRHFPNFIHIPPMSFDYVGSKTLARDGLHPGKLYHRQLAYWIMFHLKDFNWWDASDSN